MRFILLQIYGTGETCPGNPEFSREHNLKLLSKSLWERAIYSPPRSPKPRTLTNHIGVSDTGGAKSVDRIRVSSIGSLRWSGYVTPCPCPILLIGRNVIQLCAVIFSNACLVPPLELGRFHYFARPYSFLDMGLDIQARLG